MNPQTEKITIRRVNSINGPTNPLYLIDGIPSKTRGSAPISWVDKVEVLKGPDAAIYGARGANGVISVLTKRFETIDLNSIIVPGTIVKQIQGFAPFREFYSPKYTPENIDSDVPDVRTTLYWNPQIITKNGIAEVSFFTCDNVSRYKIFVEGITNAGRICLGSGEFEVDRLTRNGITGN